MFQSKGWGTRALRQPEEVIRLYKKGPRRSFADWNLQDTGAAIARLCDTLREQERIRYPYAVHDLRHR